MGFILYDGSAEKTVLCQDYEIHLVVNLGPISVLTDRLYVGHIFINSVFLTFLIFLSYL
jgi:hypothetical protein